MLSAKGSDGKTYVSGAVPDPKSRTYTCPHPKCGSPVSHVARHTRSLQHRVIEHFRHPAKASHTVKQFDWQTGSIVQALKDAFDGLGGYELSFDRFYTDAKGNEHYAEMSIRDKVLKKEAVVRIESGAFKSREFEEMLNYLSSQGLHTMLLLSASGYSNPGGQYFRDYSNQRHPDRKGLKKISGNELAMYGLLGRLLYYDHDRQGFVSAGFENYVEGQRYDHHAGEWVDGETEFETIKTPNAVLCKRFIPQFMKTGELRTAGFYPADSSKVPVLNKLYELRQAIDANEADKIMEHGERLGIMMEDYDDADYLSRIFSVLMTKAGNDEHAKA